MRNFMLGSMLEETIGINAHVLVASCVVFVVASVASAGLITNGDFEAGTNLPTLGSPQTTDWDDWTEVTGTNAPVGWTEGINFGVVDVPETGDAGTIVANIAALNALEQDIATVIGETYTITYDLGGLGGSAAPAYDSTVEVSANGVVVDTQVISQTAGGAGFINSFSVNFVATDTTTTIRFENTIDPTNDDFGPALDNVDVNLVPEPASLVLLGVSGLLMIRQRHA